MSKTKLTQVRRTYDDTRKHQKELKNLVRTKIIRDVALSFAEKETFMDTVERSVLSFIKTRCYYVAPDGRYIYLGKLYRFAESFLWQQGKIAIIYDRLSNRKYEIPYVELWKCLNFYLSKAFPSAQEEALRMSSEMPVREEISGYAFTAEEKVVED